MDQVNRESMPPQPQPQPLPSSTEESARPGNKPEGSKAPLITQVPLTGIGQDDRPFSGVDFALRDFDVEHGLMDSDMWVYNDMLRKKAKPSDRAFMTTAGIPQELYRGFSQISLICFSSTIMCTWEGVLFSGGPSLENGGPAGLLYGFVFCFVGSLATTLSLAELASMAPVSSGQYYWVWLLCGADSPCRKALSWMTGCFAFCGWQATVASGVYLFNTIVRGLMVINGSDWPFENWRSLVASGFSILLFAGTVNILLARFLSRVEGFFFILHVCGYFAVIIPLLHLSPRSDPAFVFTQLSVSTGWERNPGVAWCVGLLGTVFPLLGMDGPIHMSEEVTYASKNVPRAMVIGIIINGVMGLSMIIAWLFSMGDLSAALEHNSGYPFIYSFLEGTRTQKLAELMTAVIVTLLVFANLTSTAAASRQTYTLARDRMLPAHRLLKKVWVRTSAPIVATLVTMVLACSLSLIQLGSTAAYQSVVSLAVTGLFISYTIPISLLLYRRCFTPGFLSFGPWRLPPKFGIVCNCGAIFYTVWVVFWSLLPPDIPVHLGNVNWSPVVLAGTVILAATYYMLFARYTYNGPMRQLYAGQSPDAPRKQKLRPKSKQNSHRRFSVKRKDGDASSCFGIRPSGIKRRTSQLSPPKLGSPYSLENFAAPRPLRLSLASSIGHVGTETTGSNTGDEPATKRISGLTFDWSSKSSD